MSNQLEKIKELIERRATARMGGGDKAIAKKVRQKRAPNPARAGLPSPRVCRKSPTAAGQKWHRGWRNYSPGLSTQLPLNR